MHWKWKEEWWMNKEDRDDGAMPNCLFLLIVFCWPFHFGVKCKLYNKIKIEDSIFSLKEKKKTQFDVNIFFLFQFNLW